MISVLFDHMQKQFTQPKHTYSGHLWECQHIHTTQKRHLTITQTLTHAHTHAYLDTPSCQHTWKLHPLPPLLIQLPPSLSLPLLRSVWRWQFWLSSASLLLRWECFCFLLLWSADLILARMRLVARCCLSFPKSAFLGACYCFCSRSAGVCLCPCLFQSA